MKAFLSEKGNVQKVNSAQFSEKTPTDNFRNKFEFVKKWNFFVEFVTNFWSLAVLKAYFEHSRIANYLFSSLCPFGIFSAAFRKIQPNSATEIDKLLRKIGVATNDIVAKSCTKLVTICEMWGYFVSQFQVCVSHRGQLSLSLSLSLSSLSNLLDLFNKNWSWAHERRTRRNQTPNVAISKQIQIHKSGSIHQIWFRQNIHSVFIHRLLCFTPNNIS